MVARFEGGAERGAEILIGADGLRSTVRARLFRDEPLRDTGQVACVGIARWDGDELTLGTPVATVGRGLRFWAARMRGGLVYWYATVMASDGVDPPAGDAKARLLELFGRWHAPIREVIEATDASAIIRTRIRDRSPARAWGAGRVTLVGDAAHPCTPDLGQGACQAIESALVLAQCVRAGGAAQAALRTYERRRMRRTAAITQLSWLTATQSAVSDPIACRVRDLGVRFLLRPIAMKELVWVLGGGP